MLIPIGDEPNDHPRPAFVNYGLIAANVVVFLLTVAGVPESDDPKSPYWQAITKWGYIPTDATITTLFTHMFMHANWMHLIGNMLFLWIFGDNVEARLGHLGYLVAYLAVGVGAVLAYAAFNSGSTTPLVGASGAISGVEGMYLVACPRNRVRLLVFLGYFANVVLVPAFVIMLFWFFVQDVLPLLIGRGLQEGDSVAHLAHLGGFASGIVLMLVLKPVFSRMYPDRWTCDVPTARAGWLARPRHRGWE
jgi:membrane associated rhomboid family serine protease